MATIESDATALKDEGNKLFLEGKFEEADAIYTKAIALDGNIEVLYSNRAAVRLKLSRDLDALSDAEKCVSINPVFLKGYHRKALAHKALGDDTAAYETYVVAGKKCVKDAWLQREMKKSKKEMLRAHVEKPVKSIEHMVSIFSYMEDIWDRLSCLAYFWNAATQEERHKIFARFLALGNTPEKINDFKVEDMNSMTTENYENMGKLQNPRWMTFFKALEDKVEVLEGMWNLTTVQEKDAIIKDLQYFLSKPEPEEGGEGGAAAMEGLKIEEVE